MLVLVSINMKSVTDLTNVNNSDFIIIIIIVLTIIQP